VTLSQAQVGESLCHKSGFPGGAGGKEPTCQWRRCKRPGFNPWVGKIPWRRAWQPTPGFLLGESHGQGSLAGYSPWGQRESDTTEATWHSTVSQESVINIHTFPSLSLLTHTGTQTHTQPWTRVWCSKNWKTALVLPFPGEFLSFHVQGAEAGVEFKQSLMKAEHRRTDALELWCWRRLLKVPWTARRSNQSILKKISPEYSLEGLMLKLKLQYFGHLM